MDYIEKMLFEFVFKLKDYKKFESNQDIYDFIDKFLTDYNPYDQPERSKREDYYTHAEFQCSFPVNFICDNEIKTILPGKKYDENLNEIIDAVL